MPRSGEHESSFIAHCDPLCFGPFVFDGTVTFRLWAPAARNVQLILNGALTMRRKGDWFTLNVPNAGPGTQYRFRVDDEIEIADPASHFQPKDVHGPSELIDHGDYRWQTEDWKGLPWEKTVLLEAHVGTFTPEGTYRAMLNKLDHLTATGITALELMPLSDFVGRWNWGYDGVLPFAPDSSYGRPNDLKALIDAAHARGLMMFLDVVYNHFGPEGNHLHRIAPAFFSEAHQTPWGAAIDYRVPEVRVFTIENALHWLRNYRFDGLRLDAVHAIIEPGTPHILFDLAQAVHAFAEQSGRQIHLVLENDENAARFLAPAGGYRAQWNDDYHHGWHVLLTRERTSYYADYQNYREHIARALALGFSYQGEPSSHRGGTRRGTSSSHLPRSDFVNFLQNHDQIGNRPKGERLAALAKPEALLAAFTIMLLQPGPPLMFMGDEWGAANPFPFFCDFHGKLAAAVGQGRQRQIAQAFTSHGDEIPDPLSEQTRVAAVLDWNELDDRAAAARLELTRNLLAVRERFIVPLLPEMTCAGHSVFKSDVLQACWTAGARTLMLLGNLSEDRKRNPLTIWGEPIWGDAPPSELPPWTVYAALRDV